MAESGLKDLPEVREWSGSTPEGTGVIGRSALYYSVVQAVQQSFLPQTHEIFSYDS